MTQSTRKNITFAKLLIATFQSFQGSKFQNFSGEFAPGRPASVVRVEHQENTFHGAPVQCRCHRKWPACTWIDPLYSRLRELWPHTFEQLSPIRLKRTLVLCELATIPDDAKHTQKHYICKTPDRHFSVISGIQISKFLRGVCPRTPSFRGSCWASGEHVPRRPCPVSLSQEMAGMHLDWSTLFKAVEQILYTRCGGLSPKSHSYD